MHARATSVPDLYPLLRSALFRLPAERAHELANGALAGAPRVVREELRRRARVEGDELSIRLWGIDFPNPVGVAAGFDKGARSFNGLGALGFGFVEVGTVTAEPQAGNPPPRLFRLAEDRALLNRMGFNNPGAEAVAKRLSKARVETLLGVNVGKSKATPLERATDDYLRSLELLEPYARYLVVNVSSPNTPGLRELQAADRLRELLRAVVGRPDARAPVLVKLAPDLTDPQIDEAVDIALEERISGIVAVNTTSSREGLAMAAERLAKLGPGGISGAPLRKRATEVVGRIYRRVGLALPIIGVGGIFTADDAWERIGAGASLLQLYTGLVYEGPGVARRINQGLLERLRAGGHKSLSDAVGCAHR